MNLKEQLLHLTGYFKKNRDRKMLVSSRNSLKKLFAWEKECAFLKNILKIGFRALVSNSFTGLILKMPVVLFVAGAIVTHHHGVSIPIFLIAPVAVALALFLLINIPYLLFLGEAERYLNHVAFFIVAAGTLMTGCFYYFLISYGALFWTAELVARYALNKRSDKSDADAKVILWLQQQKSQLITLGYPYHAVGVFRIMLQTDHRVIFCFTCEEVFQKEFLERFEADYPYVNLDLVDEMASRYGVNCLILNKKALLARGFGKWKPSDQWVRTPIGDPVYAVYTHSLL